MHSNNKLEGNFVQLFAHRSQRPQEYQLKRQKEQRGFKEEVRKSFIYAYCCILIEEVLSFFQALNIYGNGLIYYISQHTCVKKLFAINFWLPLQKLRF